MPDDLQQDMQRDINRHIQRIWDRFKEGVDDIMRRRDLIGSPGGKTIRIPIRGDEEAGNPVGQPDPPNGVGQGKSRPGDVIGFLPRDGDGSGGSDEGGDEGHDPAYYIEMSVDELADIIFSSLRLPVIRPKTKPRSEEEDPRLDARSPIGPISRLDKKKSLIDHLKREILTGDSAWHDEDLKYKVFSIRKKPSFEAAVCFVRDASGSMGEEETNAVYTAAWWTVTWLRRNYANTHVHWILHGTEAVEVTEQDFFSLADMGGTMISTGVRLADAILEQQHKQSNWYLLFYSDGYNFGADNRALDSLLSEIADHYDLIGYGQIEMERKFPGPVAQSAYTVTQKIVSELAKKHDSIRVFTGLNQNTIPEYLTQMFGTSMVEKTT